MITLGDWLGTNRDLARLDAELLAADTLKLERAQIIAFPERELASAEHQQLQQGAQQLREGAPLAYVIGEREFWGLSFLVNADVLVPRPETELLVEWASQNAPHNVSVLELGTGSGAIAVAIAHERADLSVTATDISAAALRTARSNAERHQLDIHWIESDWFAQVTGKWHMIVSNPPYIAEGDVHLAQLKHEPALALTSGPQGLDALQQIIQRAGGFLLPEGWLALEHGYDQGPAVRKLLQHAGFHQVKSLPDLAGIERVSIGQYGA